MPRSDCPYCGRNVRKAYDADPCPECGALIDLKDRKLKAGSLCLPDHSGTIEDRIPLVPIFAPEGSECALCELPIEDVSASAVERCADGRLLNLHARCQKIPAEG